MPNHAFTEWATHDASYGHASRAHPLNALPEPWYRDRLDEARAGRRTPEAQFPDGYLGTSRGRREDRLAHQGGHNTGGTQKSYARGVHVGSRIPQDAYFWTDEVSLQKGLELQARGRKFAPTGDVTPYLANDGKPAPGKEARLRAGAREPRARSA